MDRFQMLYEIARTEGSLAYVFDIESLKKRIYEIKNILGDNIELCFSIKANPFLTADIIDDVNKLEVCSPGELDICRRLLSGQNLSKIVYSGVCKTYQDYVEAYENCVGVYTVESEAQMDIIGNIAKEKREKLPVLLRLNSGSQFGMSKDSVLKIIHERNNMYPNIDIVGIHYFAGTQRANKDLKKQKAELEMLHELYDVIYRTENFRLERLEYGPGLPVPLFNGDDFDDTLNPLKRIIDELKSVNNWAKLTIEMGRFIATESGYFIARVVETKIVDGNKYAFLDGGINNINYVGQIMGMKTPVIKHLKESGEIVEGVDEEWKIYGSLCTTNDCLTKSYKTSDMEIGDYLIFCNIGAYSVTEAMYLFLSRKIPKVILIEDDDSVVVNRDYIESSKINSYSLE